MGTVQDELGGVLLDQNNQPILDESTGADLGTQWVVYVRDETGARRAQLDTYSDATLVLRFNAVGDWRLTAPTSAAATLLATDRYGVEFVRDGEVILSGQVTNRTRKFDASFDGYEFRGVDDNWWLWQRLASPEPATSSQPYDDSEYDVRTGSGSTVIQAYVDVNAGPSAVTARQVESLEVPAVAAFGSTVTGRARWQVLGDLLAELATSAGLGFRINRLAFEVYQPVDRSAQVKFSVALGNVAAFSYSDAAPDVNHVYVAGGGEGTARVIREATDSDSVTAWGRIERFRDRRDTTDTTELDQSGSEALTDGASKRGFSITPIETGSVRFSESYFLGDRVTVVADDVPLVDVVREVVINLNENGETVTPTVGNPDASPERPNIFATVKKLARDVRNLQRS
jgi:hypothetical protein